jgi:hypothetical protein
MEGTMLLALNALIELFEDLLYGRRDRRDRRHSRSGD